MPPSYVKVRTPLCLRPLDLLTRGRTDHGVGRGRNSRLRRVESLLEGIKTSACLRRVGMWTETRGGPVTLRTGPRPKWDVGLRRSRPRKAGTQVVGGGRRPMTRRLFRVYPGMWRRGKSSRVGSPPRTTNVSRRVGGHDGRITETSSSSRTCPLDSTEVFPDRVRRRRPKCYRYIGQTDDGREERVLPSRRTTRSLLPRTSDESHHRPLTPRSRTTTESLTGRTPRPTRTTVTGEERGEERVRRDERAVPEAYGDDLRLFARQK